jgi:hypothetical protein
VASSRDGGRHGARPATHLGRSKACRWDGEVIRRRTDNADWFMELCLDCEV